MARRDDLSKPRGTPGGPQYDPDAFGRFAEKIARYLGTGRYLAIQTVIVVLWILVNVAAVALRFEIFRCGREWNFFRHDDRAIRVGAAADFAITGVIEGFHGRLRERRRSGIRLGPRW